MNWKKNLNELSKNPLIVFGGGGLILFILIFAGLAQIQSQNFIIPIFPTITPAQIQINTTTATFRTESAEISYELEIAATESERAQGLMNRTYLAADAGMLFIFPVSDYHGFWMKNTLIPLDIVFLDENKRIVSIAEATVTNNSQIIYRPVSPARYVIELNLGESEKYNFQEGDLVEFDY